MGVSRKIRICAAALAGLGLGMASTADAQRCQHIGRWTRTADGFVCSGDYTSGECLWYDDCRVYAE
jgi:hypothetical protein